MSNIQAEFELHPEGSLPVSCTAGQTVTPPSGPYPATNQTAAEQALPCSMLPKKRLQRSPIQPVLSGCCGDLHRPLRCTLGSRMGIVTPDQCPFGGCHDGLHKLTEIQIAQFGKLPDPGYCLQKCLFVHRLPHPAQRIVLSLAFDGKQIRIPGQNAKSIQAQFFQDDSGRNFLLPYPLEVPSKKSVMNHPSAFCCRLRCICPPSAY